ncbi:MAG: adenylate kinase [Candidatus Eremiobacteraeota bacterium]|nr:adenylate kinase [Candidatus Eremiobacteraeota bacterium]
MRLVFLGPPGAGKGTQARILSERFGARQISTGDILRDNQERQTDLGHMAESYMQRGDLVPDALIVKMIEAELAECSNFIMDGFPRTVAQAEALDALLKEKRLALDAAVLFAANPQTLVARLTSRWTNPRTGRTYNTITDPPRVAGIDDEDGGPLMQRDDDRPETVIRRLEVYDAQTKPLVAFYRATGRLVEVDALQPVDAVTAQILKVAISRQPQAAS